jgi:hypothetical protein
LQLELGVRVNDIETFALKKLAIKEKNRHFFPQKLPKIMIIAWSSSSLGIHKVALPPISFN